MTATDRAATPAARTRKGILPWRIERRPDPDRIGVYRLVAVLVGLAISLIVAPILSGVPVGDFYKAIWTGTIGTALGWSNVLTIAIPLTLAGLAAAIPYRLSLWNVGIDGQMLMGAWAATGVGLWLPNAPGPLLILVMIIAGLIAGALWIVIPTWARVAFGVSEVITTFLLNFVAVAWLVYWCTGPWRAPGVAGGIRAAQVPEQSWLPMLDIHGAQVNLGIVLVPLLPVAFWAYSRFTRRGYEVTMLGANPQAGGYAGMRVKRHLITAMLMGGAIAGLAGAINMLGTSHELSPGLTYNTGFNGLVVAVLAGANELGVLALSAVYSLLLAGGGSLGIIGVSSDLVFAIIGVTLVFGSLGEAYARLRLVRTTPRGASSPTAPPPSITPSLPGSTESEGAS
ncbi:MAG: ABC transporter permease [Actinomycetes bacterium]